jgi:hypothetical protein
MKNQGNNSGASESDEVDSNEEVGELADRFSDEQAGDRPDRSGRVPVTDRPLSDVNTGHRVAVNGREPAVIGLTSGLLNGGRSEMQNEMRTNKERTRVKPAKQQPSARRRLLADRDLLSHSPMIDEQVQREMENKHDVIKGLRRELAALRDQGGGGDWLENGSPRSNLHCIH